MFLHAPVRPPRRSVPVAAFVTTLALLAVFPHALYAHGNGKKGRCTGSAYCRACKNCKYCAHCNSGGSCGVCSSSFTPPPPPSRPASRRTPSYSEYLPDAAYSTSPSSPRTGPYLSPRRDFSRGVPGVISIRTAVFRDAPYKTGTLVRNLSKGVKVHALAEENGYYKLQLADGQTGWTPDWAVQLSRRP
jgi:hypothetical protein